MSDDKRIENEIKHGKYIAEKGEQIWNWSSPAGKMRWERRANMFLEFLGNNEKRILEIGCGTGLFTKEIAKIDKQIIVSIDISNELIKLAREKVERKNVSFIVTNGYDTGFKSNSFDMIIGISTLHHLDIDMALREFFRLLKPDGKIMFTEPNMLNPQIALQKNIPFIKKIMGDSPDETAFFKWSIKKKFLDIGFSMVNVNPFDFLHPSIPEFAISIVKPVATIFETIPIIKEFGGSLLIQAVK